MSISTTFRNAFAIALFFCGLSTQAQDLPGTAVADSALSTNAITLISLAEQKYPELFSNATSWRTFDGFFYKYFAKSGVYVGINGSDLYLLGGPFGNTVVNQGKIADAVVALQGETPSNSGLFQNTVTASTLRDLLRYFRGITVAYSSISSFGNLQSAVALEAVGQEVVGDKTTDKLIVTLSGSNLASPLAYQMWVDSEGIIVKLLQNGFEFAYPTSNAVGAGLVSGMLLALKGAEAPAVQQALANELANNPAVSQKVVDAVISGNAVKTLALQIGSAGANILLELSDFGAFSIATKMESTLSATKTSFELKDLVLR